MTRQQILELATSYLETSPGNRVSPERALRPELAGLKMYDPPIIGVASAQDDYLLSLQATPGGRLSQPPPAFWLESAKSVVSLFFPLTEQVRESNRKAPPNEPSHEMMHSRNDGQVFIFQLCEYLKGALEKAGYAVVIPSRDPRFWATADKPVDGKTFTSNWSERHVAFACGVGTFSLHGGIITKAGGAGRLASLVTDLELEPTLRPYRELDEYCTKCGVCIASCPGGAITFEDGKSSAKCRAFLAGIDKVYADWGGTASCGKCQINAPCETGIPGGR